MSQTAILSDEPLNKEIQIFGRHVFEQIGKERPSTFNKNFWAGRVMEWSMRKPSFKVNMFRLVDVLPSLRSSRAIVQHVQEYLGALVSELPGLIGGGLLEWGLSARPDSLRGRVTSFMVMKGVREMANMFIAGETPTGSLKALKRIRSQGLAFTVDLLGEYCVNEDEAQVYLNRYQEALQVLGTTVPHWRCGSPLVINHPGEQSPVCVSVKLSALYSQCSPLNFSKTVATLSDRLAGLAEKAKEVNAQVYVDAEDTGTNPMIYRAFKRVYGDSRFREVPYPGVVVQAYAKGAEATLHDLIAFAKQRGTPIAVRLVKGAYWDHETILSAQNDWPSPLFSKKESTDAFYEAMTRLLIDNAAHCLPAFGSHNVRSLSHACCYAKAKGLRQSDFELQMLYGMAEPIARAFSKEGYLVRLYVPLGNMVVGMGYLVRRLLENTSNESFLRHTFFDASNIEELLEEPRISQ